MFMTEQEAFQVVKSVPRLRSTNLRAHIEDHATLHARRSHTDVWEVQKPMYVFKSVFVNAQRKCIANLIVPKGALIVTARNLSERKMRASEAFVHSLYDVDKGEWVGKAESHYTCTFKYVPGATLRVTNAIQDTICAPGIHFFVNIRDAWDY